MKRVCCFCETWESGGIESFLNNVLTNMDLSGLEVDLVAVRMQHSIFTDNLRKHNINVIQLSDRKCNELRKRYLFRRHLKKVKYDVIHFNLFHGVAMGYVNIADDEGVPVRIVHSHNTDLRKSSTRWLKMILHNSAKRFYSGKATKMLACSEAAAEFLFSQKDLEKSGFSFIPNGIDVDRFAFSSKKREIARKELKMENDFIIGAVGRLCYQKNQTFLLDVAGELSKIRSDFKLLLVGEGDDLQKLKEKTESMGLSDKVIFYGVTDKPHNLFCAMDVLAFPSLFEGLGIVAIEAQASGLPVICSEFVPHEAKVSDLATVQPLSDGVSGWVEALRHIQIQTEREKYTDIVKKSGFDIHEVAFRMEKIFKGEV